MTLRRKPWLYVTLIFPERKSSYYSLAVAATVTACLLPSQVRGGQCTLKMTGTPLRDVVFVLVCGRV